MNPLLEEALKKEKLVFNDLNNKRRQADLIPLEFDYDYNPVKFDFERYTAKKMGKKSVDNFLTIIKETKGAKVIDVCCGPGWVSLLASTRGANVSGYDISDIAIANANISHDRNIDRIQFADGKLEYFNQSVHSIPFLDQEKSVNVFIGWSAFHHLDEMDNFFKRMQFSLKDGGYIISVDDIGSKKINRIITWVLKFILPLKGVTYANKIGSIGTYLRKLYEPEVEWHTPMESFVGKHENAAQKIEDILKSDYNVIHNYRYCAFIHYFVYDLGGPNWFRKMVFDILWPLDCFLVSVGICKGNLRFMAVKKNS